MITTRNGKRLASATQGKYARYPLKTYDDGYSFGYPLWLYGQEYGPTMLIAAGSFEDAYEIAMDESKTVSEDDLYEAYGFDTQAEYDKWTAERDEDDYRDLAEGFQYQSNSTGTGIVNVGYYEWLREFQKQDVLDYGIQTIWED